NQRANRLGRYLRELGVKPDTRVAICMERGLEMVVGLLGVLKAGGAYVPLDPAYPPERLRYMLEDSNPVALLTQENLSGPFLGVKDALPVVDLMNGQAVWGRYPDGNLAHASESHRSKHLAYVIYTSGSTGTPKGVMVDHGGVVNLLSSMQQIVSVGPGDCVLGLTTLAFDIAGLELYLPLMCGARIALAGSGDHHDPERLAGRMAKAGVTVVQATPATWRMLLEAGCISLEGVKALCGGEALPAEQARRIRGRVGGLWNVNGPTETTIGPTVAGEKAGRRAEEGGQKK